MIKWADIKDELRPDGGLRDIRIQNAGDETWKALLALLKSSPYSMKFYHQGERDLPSTFGEIYALQNEDATLLKIFLNGNIQVNCHFFFSDWIEFDIDPREIKSEQGFQEIVDFMSFLAKNLNEVVVLIHENSPDSVILTINP